MPALAERVGSRKTVSVWLMLSGVPCLISLAFANGYWMALLSIVPLWFGAAFFGLLLGLVGDMARQRAREDGRDRSGAVIAALQTAAALGGAVAPLLGGWLYELTGQLRPGILLHLVPGLVATWVLWKYVQDDRVAPAAGGAPTADPASVRRGGTIGLALLFFLVVEVWFRLGDARGPFETIYAAQELAASKAQVGLLLTVAAALLLVMTPVMGVLSDGVGAGKTTMVGIALLATHGFLLAGTTAFWQQVVLLVVAMAGLAIGSSAPFVYAQQLAPGRAAMATGWLNACFFLGLAGGSPLAGRVVELAGFRGLFVFSGGMDVIAAALVGILVLGRMVRTGSPAPRTPG
jgi:MFS family permease